MVLVSVIFPPLPVCLVSCLCFYFNFQLYYFRLKLSKKKKQQQESVVVVVVDRRATVSKMPFIQRNVEPVFLSRPTQQSTAAEQPSNASKSTHDDFTSIANCTLANILRQLASVVLVADGILSELGNELQLIRDRSSNIQKRIVGVEKTLENVETTIICKFSMPPSPPSPLSFIPHYIISIMQLNPNLKWRNKKKKMIYRLSASIPYR